jgi:hypothetical protein
VKLDWFKTRTVHKWSGVVRQEKSAQHYQKEQGGKKTSEASSSRVVAAGAGDETKTEPEIETQKGKEEKKFGGRRYEEKAAKSGAASFDSQSVANAIRERREEEVRKSPKPSREDIRKGTNEKAMQAILNKN